MSEQRKYRAERVDGKGLVYGSRIVNCHGQHFIVDPIQIHITTERTSNGGTDIAIVGCHEVIPASVAQSTGKEDGRKREVYHGDTLKSLTSKRMLIVLWSDEMMCFMAKDKHSGHENPLSEWGLNNFEVIAPTTDAGKEGE